MKHYRILSLTLASVMILGTLVGCGKEETPEKEYEKTIVCTDFTSYDIARRIADGTDVKVEGIDFGQIDWEKGLSGRDRSKINNSMLFINGTWMTNEEIGGLDENLNGISLGDFAEKKENSKDDNKLYSGLNLIINSSSSETDSSDSNNEKHQVIVNPNAGSNENKDDKNNNSSNNGNENSDDNKNSNGSGSGNGNSNGNDSNNDDNNNSSDNKDSEPDDGNWKDNTGNDSSTNGDDDNNNGISNQEKTGVRLWFTSSSYDAPPVAADRNGKTLADYKAGDEFWKSSMNTDPYWAWLCDRIASMDSGMLYYIIDAGNGRYTVLQSVGYLLPDYKVIGSVDDIEPSAINGITDVCCESSTKSMLSSYSDLFMEGSPNSSASIEGINTEKIALSATVDFAKGLWLDVKNTREMTVIIKDKLIEIDPENKNKYEENWTKVDSDLASLDDKYQLAVDSSANKTIFIGGAFVYKYMVDSYGIDYVSIYDYSTQDEAATPTRLINFAELLSTYKIKYIVKDKQSTMDGIDGVKAEISHNLNTLIIDTLEYVENWESSSYFDLMEDNCTILKKALY